MATGTRVEFRDLTKVFDTKGGSVTALDNINLSVEPGEVIGIIGYSGAGKSTLVRMINGLETPTSGQVLVGETNIVGMPEKKLRDVRRGIGMIFQQFNLLTSRTAAGNIEYPLQLAGMPKREPGAAVGWPEAARRHCPSASDKSAASVGGRGHQRPRP